MGPALPLSVFCLGLLGGRLRFVQQALSHIQPLHQRVRRWLCDLLLISIGLKGGMGGAQAFLRGESVPSSVLVLALCGIVYGALLPRWLSGPLARWLGWRLSEASTLAGYYGSVSLMTFASASLWLDQLGVPFHPAMTLLLLAMEFPALVTALLVHKPSGQGSATDATPRSWCDLVLRHRIFWMLLIAMALGYMICLSSLGALLQQTLSLTPLIMMLFLFDQGCAIAMSRSQQGMRLSSRLTSFAILFPSLQALAALCGAWALGARMGDAVLFATLMASASYLAAPAFFSRFRPSPVVPICTAASLGITFPWNLVITLPVLLQLGQILWS